MEDTDASGTRKRPRLDSGDRFYRSMSADRLGATPTDPELAKDPTTPPRAHISSHLSETAGGLPSMSLTPSKEVTINVREPSTITSPTQISAQIGGTPSLRGGGGGDHVPSSSNDPSSKLDSSPSNVISVTSSPCSPEIEVAEIEDMNDESGETRWKPLISATSLMDAKDIQQSVLEDFPYLGERSRNLRKTVAVLAQTFEKGDLDDGEYFRRLSIWIEMYLETTEPHTSQWWEMYHEQRAFWEEFPSLVDGLLKRSNKIGNVKLAQSSIGDTTSSIDPLQDFFVAYTALAMRMARIDNQTLAGHLEDPGNPPDLICNRYLIFLHQLQSHTSPFWKSVVDTSRYDVKVPVTAIVSRFIQPPASGIRCMTEICRELFERSQKCSGLTQSIWVHLNIANKVMNHYRVLQSSSAATEEAWLPSLMDLPYQMYQFFSVIDNQFQTLISKQVSALSIETSQGLVNGMSTLLQNIACSDEQLTRKYIHEELALTQDFDRDDGALLVELAWKFGLLKKCILEGRMEIRVQGVDTMQLELVQVYQKYVQNREGGKDHPTAQYLSDFMLDNKLVDYFVGVESHPQLINRCANIVGFLVVTGRYTEVQSDVIWKGVVTSPDSRFIDALLIMLNGIFNIAGYPILLYLTAKLNEIPIHAFDASMNNYGRTLLDHLRRTWSLSQSENPVFPQRMDMAPFHLCIRLICQSLAESSLEHSRKREIHNFARNELASLLEFGPSDSDRKAIYKECIKDISDRTEYATGSISAMSALINQNPEGEIIMLTKGSNVTSLMIEEFAHMIDIERSSNGHSQMLEERLDIRCNLIQHIIVSAPDTITTSAGGKLWDFAVGSRAPHDRARSYGWMCFLKALRRCKATENPFVDQLIKEYLPRLQPRYYNSGCLQFVQEVVHYQSCMATSRLDKDANGGPTATDLLWQLSLTAPPGSIEHKSISLLVALCLDSPDVQRRTQAATDAIHIEIVQRCIRQLSSAASKLRSYSDGTSSGEDEPMVIVASEDEVQAQKLCFSRSLMILKEFIHGVRSRPQYSPQPQSQPQLPQESRGLKGDPVSIRYQSFSGGAGTDIRTLEVGDLETIQDLSSRLISLTSFPNFSAIAGGQVLNLKSIANQTLRSLKFDQKGLLIVRRVADAESVPPLSHASGLRPVELEILAHFSELYQLLGMEDKLAKEVHEFLVAFPPHSSITALILSQDTTLEAVFPPTAPFKILYSVYALRTCLVQQTQNGPANVDFIHHGIQLLSATMSTLNLNLGSHGAEVDIVVALGLVDCLHMFLKEPMPAEVGLSLFPNPLALLKRLLSMISEALTVLNSSEADFLAINSFAALLKASLCSDTFWKHLKDADVCSELLQRLLLDEPKWQTRVRVAEWVKSICRSQSASQTATAENFNSYLWENIAKVIPHCLQYRNTASQQFFEVATLLFRSTGDAYYGTLDVSSYVHGWSGLLLKHEHEEFVGRDQIDWIVLGLSSLLNWSFQVLKSLGKPLEAPDGLAEKLFRAHLFPEIPSSINGALTQTRMPNLFTRTREEIYSIILALSNDMGGYQKLLMLVRDLLSQECHYEPNLNFDRTKCIRAPAGYPGLRNLSNTCYMNSLFTQLFMNVKFRGFMLNTNVADGSSSQRLLHETQQLFAFMQESMLKFVDPSGIAESLITYDNTAIDVSIQMDVDEFYNLLFDRWESQILSGADKKTFRAFYGGQIVQQIKSKECSHISERLEPFSAIQCDIQGKLTLLDSLNAYVGGEVMEGDNKYSCTSCGCYVDAVKRACLKDIPNNLIFHLKRFDYDVMTGMRSKINDIFEFPEQIDMAPYHVDYLKDPGESASTDLFNLVGVLVHSGTAESGHYYSYIQERPLGSASGKTWVEFNDIDVVPFDNSHIPDQCFGGFTESSGYSSRYLKSWNAYMLFYERCDPKSSHDETHSPKSFGVPAKSPMPTEIETPVAFNNGGWLRTYCMFDPAHAAFVRQLLEQLRIVNEDKCTADHGMEKEAILLSLDHLDRVLSRSKDCPDFGKMLASLTKVIGSCSTCCRFALDWVLHHESALRNLLLRCPSPKVRKDFAGMILVALKHLRNNEPRWFGFDEADEIARVTSRKDMHPDGVFPRLVRRLKDLWNFMPVHIRAWDDYFGLLAEMVLFGVHECHVLLNQGFLSGCLEILLVDNPKVPRLRNEHPHYGHYFRLVEKGRNFSLNKLTELLANLLDKVELRDETVRGTRERKVRKDGMPLTFIEDQYMRFGSDLSRSKDTCVFLTKILEAGSNPPATKRIIRAMVLAEPDFGTLTLVQNTIISGINIDPATLAAPFLRAAIVFCESCPAEINARHVINYIAGEVDTIGVFGGREHLDFFSQARRIQSLSLERSPDFFNRCVLKTVPQWAPPLVMYFEEPVRNSTIDLLKTLVFGHDIKAMDDEEYAELIERVGRDLQVACTRRCHLLVQAQKTQDAKSVEQVITVIRHCLQMYYGPEHDQRPIVEAENIVASLEALTVSDVDEAASETWNNASDDIPTDSDSEFPSP